MKKNILIIACLLLAFVGYSQTVVIIPSPTPDAMKETKTIITGYPKYTDGIYFGRSYGFSATCVTRSLIGQTDITGCISSWEWTLTNEAGVSAVIGSSKDVTVTFPEVKGTYKVSVRPLTFDGDAGFSCLTATYTLGSSSYVEILPSYYVPPITGNLTVCGVTSTTKLSNTVSGGTWSSSNTSVATVSSTGLVTGRFAGQTTITYSVNVRGMLGSATARVFFISIPTTPYITGNYKICSNATRTESYFAQGNFDDVSYVWSLSNSSLGTLQYSGTSKQAFVTYGSQYSAVGAIQVTVANGCGSATGSQSISVANPSVTPTVPIPEGPTTVCDQRVDTRYQCSQLNSDAVWQVTPASAGTISALGPYGAMTINWDDNFSGTATIQVKTSNACTSSAWSSPLSVNVGRVIKYVDGPNVVYNKGADPIYGPGGSGLLSPSTFTWTFTPANALSGRENYGPYGREKLFIADEFTGTLTIKAKYGACESDVLTVNVLEGNQAPKTQFLNNTLSLNGGVITGSIPTFPYQSTDPINYKWYYNTDGSTWTEVPNAPNSKDFTLPVNRRATNYMRVPYSTYVSGPNSNTINVTPKTVAFNGSQYAQMPLNSQLSLGASNFTMEAWIKATGTTDVPQVVSTRTTTDNGFLFGLLYGKPFVQMSGGGNYTCGTCAEMRDNTCHHIAIVRNGTSLYFYVDGALIETTTQANIGRSIVNSSYPQIGRDIVSLWNTYFNGTLDEIRIWNIARSTSEIASNFRARLTGNETGLITYLKMNEGTGQVLTNSKAGAGDATLGASSAVEGIDPTWANLACGNYSYRVDATLGTSSAALDSAGTGYQPHTLHAYPNPITEGKLHFGRTVSSFTLSNSAGIPVTKGSNVNGMQISDLPKGLYYLELDGKTEKIIVQ